MQKIKRNVKHYRRIQSKEKYENTYSQDKGKEMIIGSFSKWSNPQFDLLIYEQLNKMMYYI